MKLFTPYSLLLFLLITGSQLRAQLVVSQVQTWAETVDASDLNTPEEAGENLNNLLETSTDFNELDIRNVQDAQQWKITVSRSDLNWPTGLTAFVKRTSNGNPCPSCTGVDAGTSYNGYLQVSSVEQDFIVGTGEVSAIELQFKVEGISLTVPVDDYQTEIIYTLYGE